MARNTELVSYVPAGTSLGSKVVNTLWNNRKFIKEVAKEAYKMIPARKANPPPTRRQRKETSSLALSSSQAITRAPVSIGTKVTSRAPKISRSGGRSAPYRVTFRELLDPDVLGFTDFVVNGPDTFQVNPGLAKSFPWLSTTASQYEQYRILSLKYIYVPFVNTSTNGTIMMMMDYDASDPVPATETQFMDHPGAVSCSVWESLTFVCDPKSMHAIGPRKFVRPCAVAGDVKTFDSGVFYLATDNVSSNEPIGKLYVEYSVEFFIPQLNPTIYKSSTITDFSTISTPQTITKNVATNIAFVTDGTVNNSPLGFISSGAINNIYTPPAGTYLIDVVLTLTDNANEISNWELTFLFNGSVVADLSQNVYSPALAESMSVQIVGKACLSFSGTDALKIQITGTGSSGTLVVAGGSLTVLVA